MVTNNPINFIGKYKILESVLAVCLVLQPLYNGELMSKLSVLIKKSTFCGGKGGTELTSSFGKSRWEAHGGLGFKIKK